jgi:integrase/recombinase XerD
MNETDTAGPRIYRNSQLSRYIRRTKARQSKHTQKNLNVSLRQWTSWLANQGIWEFTDATDGDVDDWIDDLRLDGYADKSILNKFYDISKTYRQIGHDICEHIEVDHLSNEPHIDTHAEIRYIEKDEYKQLLEACPSPRETLLLELLWSTGVRANEASQIRIRDIDRDKEEIKIKTGKQKRGRNVERTVYYGRELSKALREWLDYGARNAYLHSDTSNHLLLTKQSGHMSPNRISEIVNEVATEAGLQEVMWTTQDGRPQHRIHPHSFRHSFCVHRVRAGMPIVFLQELAGHHDLSVTKQYLKFKDEDIKEAYHRYRP